QLEPRGLLGRTVAAVEFGLRTRRAVERLCRRMDAALTGKLGSGRVDPFEEPATLTGPQRRRLDQLLDQLSTRGVDPRVVEGIGAFLAEAPPQEVARLRPLARARRLGVEPDSSVTRFPPAAP